MKQEQGPVGVAIGSYIRFLVKNRFRAVYWTGPKSVTAPTVFVTNHHGWFDGFLMYLLVKRLGVVTIDWMQEFDQFPLFRTIGVLPFPADDPARRMQTIRETVRKMKEENVSLLFFAGGNLTRPTTEVPSSTEHSLKQLRKLVGNVTFTPVCIQYEMSLHERPEAIIRLGSATTDPAVATHQLGELLQMPFEPEALVLASEILIAGKADASDRHRHQVRGSQ